MTISKFYTKTATVERLTWADDGSGNLVSGVSSAGTILGHLQQASPELVQGLADKFNISHTFWCAKGSDVKAGETIIIDSERYGVKDIQDNTFTGTNKHLELQLEKETG